MKQGPLALGMVVRHHRRLLLLMAPSDFLSAAVPLPGCSGYRRASLPPSRRGRGRGGSPHFRGRLSDRSEPTTPEGSSVPASGSLAPSMAFAVTAAARHPPGPPCGEVMLTTLVGPRNAVTDRRRSHSLRTGQLFHPASHPASRPRTGVSLPRTRTSPGARPSLASRPQFARSPMSSG
jgi:hypothetical protein